MLGNNLNLAAGVQTCFFDSGDQVSTNVGNVSWAIATDALSPTSSFTVVVGYSDHPSLCSYLSLTIVSTVESTTDGKSEGSIVFPKPDAQSAAVLNVVCPEGDCILNLLATVENIAQQ